MFPRFFRSFRRKRSRQQARGPDVHWTRFHTLRIPKAKQQSCKQIIVRTTTIQPWDLKFHINILLTLSSIWDLHRKKSTIRAMKLAGLWWPIGKLLNPKHLTTLMRPESGMACLDAPVCARVINCTGKKKQLKGKRNKHRVWRCLFVTVEIKAGPEKHSPHHDKCIWCWKQVLVNSSRIRRK